MALEAPDWYDKKEESKNNGRQKTSFERISELEVQIQTNKAEKDKEIQSFQDKLKSLEAKIDQLLSILHALETIGKMAMFFEKFIVFCGKAGVAVGFTYAVWRFGIVELANEVKKVTRL